MYCWQNVGKMLARLPTLRQRCQLMANVGPTMNVCWAGLFMCLLVKVKAVIVFQLRFLVIETVWGFCAE